MNIPIEQLITHLDQVAHTTAAGVDPDEAADGGAALLFIGRAQVAVPELLLHQVEQQPLDLGAVVGWQMPRRAVTGSKPVFHRLNAFLQQQLHCSRPKAGEIIALLRLKRWLTLREVRDAHGYRLSFVTLLHDSPLVLDETPLIDPGFRAYLLRAHNHHSTRTRGGGCS